MADNVLICTKPNDEHAQLIAVGLKAYDCNPVLFYASKMPFYESQSYYIDRQGMSFKVDDVEIFNEDLRYVRIWLRRIGTSSLNLFDINQDDKKYVSSIVSMYTRSLFHFIENLDKNSDIMVNSYTSKTTTESKMLQLLVAKRLGLSIPDTLLSNNASHIGDFQKKNGGRIICKSLIAQTWRSGGSIAFAYTSIVPPVAEIPADILQIHPAIYQGYVDKWFEIRVVIFGGRQFGIVIDSQSHEETRIDWRGKRLFKNNNQVYVLPDDIFAKCLGLMRDMGIKYGAFDFIVTPEGEHVFLEVNEAGQFLFVEDCCPEHKVADAFCHFLIHGNLESWDPRNTRILLNDLLDSDDFKSRMDFDRRNYFYDRDGMMSKMGEEVGSRHQAEFREAGY